MAILDDFKARFPEFDTTQVDTFLPTQIEVYPYYWGGEYTGRGVEIVLNLLAHLLVQATSDGTGALQAASSKSVGSVSVGYNLQTRSERELWFRSTQYGMRFLFLTMYDRGGCFV